MHEKRDRRKKKWEKKMEERAMFIRKSLPSAGGDNVRSKKAKILDGKAGLATYTSSVVTVAFRMYSSTSGVI